MIDAVVAERKTLRPLAGNGGHNSHGIMASRAHIVNQCGIVTGQESVVIELGIDPLAAEQRGMRQPGLTTLNGGLQAARDHMQAGVRQHLLHLLEARLDQATVTRVGDG